MAALPVGAALAVTEVYFRADTLIVSLFRDYEEVGFYALGYRVVELLGVLPAIVMTSVFPLMSRYLHENRDLARRTLDAAADLFVALGLPLAAGGLVVAPQLVRLIGGDDFEGAADTLRILLFAGALAFVSGLFGMTLIAGDRQRSALRLALAALVLNVPLNFALVPSLGIDAAAATAVASEAAAGGGRLPAGAPRAGPRAAAADAVASGCGRGRDGGGAGARRRLVARPAGAARSRDLPRRPLGARRDRPAHAGGSAGVRASVLVLSPEPVGERMAGPAIRAAELARVLAAEHDVTLAAPAPSRAPGEEVQLLEAGFEQLDALIEAAPRHDVVVAQELPPTLLGRLVRGPARIVLDLYNPVVVEVLEAVAARPARAQRRIQSLIASRSLAQLAVADFVVCASERQRDLWLGGMALSGLIDLDAYRRDPTLRSLIDVVPFGIPAEPPRPPRNPLCAQHSPRSGPTTACCSGPGACGAGSIQRPRSERPRCSTARTWS